MDRRPPTLWLPALLILALAQGCAHQTQFTTSPEGVVVTLETTELGTTGPDGVSVTKEWAINEGFPRQYTVTLKKPGYKPRKEIITSAYHADESLAWLAAFIFPYFFTARLEKTYHFELEPDVPEELEPDTGKGPDLGGPDLD